MSTAQPLFKTMSPEVQALYDSIMQHGDNCQADVEMHKVNALIFSTMMGNHMKDMQRTMMHSIEQSRMLEENAREVAYLLLKHA